VSDETLNPGGDAETSLRDDLRSAMEEIEAREAAPAQPAQEAAPAEAQAEPSRDDGRDAQGRFTPKAKPEETPAVAAQPTGQPTAEQPKQEAETAPSSWRSAASGVWAQVPAEARAEIMRREKEMASLAGRMDQERAFGREFAEIVRPHAETIKGFNVSPQIAVKTLLANDAVMRGSDMKAKVQLAYRMLQDYGLNPAAFAQPLPGTPTDPHVAAMQREMEQMRARLAQHGQPQPQFTALPTTEEAATVPDNIEAFRSDPAHPHFDRVATTMATLIESGAAPGLEEAYQMAVAGDPSLRSTPAATTAQPAQRPQAVSAARAASVSVAGSPGGTGTPRPATLRDELREQLRGFGMV
jgi:hypothetical protein